MSRARKITATLAFLIVVGLILPPFINANRFRKRLATSASGALGRSVSIGDVQVRLLPRPGFDIKNFVVADDPAFSAEPLLRAPEVTAMLRITSLWRGKFEIARLNFKYPSLNLVRNANGAWNIEGLLRYTSSLRTAPTGRTRPESNPRFPYIEADSGRINFKILQEKKVYALADTDFALWLESENQWNMRLEGRPIRTDANLSDTGSVRMEGSMRRGETLEKSSLQMRMTLTNSQLGQFSTLLSGRDHGWRGNVGIAAIAEGTLENLNIAADAKIVDFRRYDIASIEPLFLATHCTGALLKTAALNMQSRSASGPMLSNINCSSPIGAGKLALNGSISLAEKPDYDLALIAANIPVYSATSLLRRVKRNIPDDLLATGLLSGNFFFRSLGTGESTQSIPVFRDVLVSGAGRALNLRFASKSLASDLNVGTVSFGFDTIPSDQDAHAPVARLKTVNARKIKKPLTHLAATLEPALRIDPFIVSLGQEETVNCSASIGGHDYSLKAKGEGDIAAFTRAARTFGLGSSLPYAEGHANFDISLNGTWAGFAAPAVSGSAQLRRVAAPLPGADYRIHIASANLSLAPNEIAVQKLVATFSGTRTAMEGSINIPRSCDTASCPVRFDLQATEINFDDLNRVLNPQFRTTGWREIGGQLLGASRGDGPTLLQLDAVGTMSVTHMLMKSLVANNVTTQLEVKHGIVELRRLQGELLGGHYSGEWTANFTGTKPVYSGAGTLEGVPFSQLNALMRTTVGTGIVTRASLKLELSGSDANTLKKTATGQLSFSWTNGSISTTLVSGKASPLQFSSWQADSSIADQKFSLISGSLETANGRYTTTGSITFAKDLNLQLVNSNERLSLTGVLEAPVLHLGNGSKAVESASNPGDAKPSKTP